MINMEGLEPCIAELFSACHGRGDIAGCIGGLGSIRFTCPFVSVVTFTGDVFDPKKHGMIWDNKLPSLFQMIQKCEAGKKLQHALRQWLLEGNLLHYLWLNIPCSGCRKRGNIETSSPQPIQHSWAGGLTRWFAAENTRTKGHSVVFLDLLDVKKIRILPFLDTSISDFLSPKTRYAFQKIQLVTSGNSNYIVARVPEFCAISPDMANQWHRAFGNEIHSMHIHASFLWRCLKYGTWVYSSCYRLAVCPAGTIIGRAASCPVDG